MAGRYYRPPRPTRSDEEWRALAMRVLLTFLEREHAATVIETEAKISDRTYDALICPDPINPHHLTTARQRLAAAGEIEPTTAPAKSVNPSGKPDLITTWSLPVVRGRKTVIATTAERKRALMARWLSWGHRHLLGTAGESALAQALAETNALLAITGSTRQVLEVPVNEVDNTAVYVDLTGGRMTPVQVMFEVKNTREHYYANDADVLTFLAKAALVQDAKPDQLLLPVFVCRRWHYTLWDQGAELGFLPAMVIQQVVHQDPDLSLDEGRARFQEVFTELLPDLVVLNPNRLTTNRHRGIVNKLIPKDAVTYARRWSENYARFMPASPSGT